MKVNDYFTAHFHGAHGQLQPDDSVAHGIAMADPEQLAEAVLELLDAETGVGEPATIEHLSHTFRGSDLCHRYWTANVELLVVARPYAENRGIADALFCQHIRGPLEFSARSLNDSGP